MSCQSPQQSKPAFRRNLLEKYLRQQIQLRQERFDEPLGTELQLAEIYHLSRNTVRKVLQQLQN
jgi:DNA-binding GntR family transcriptional regulator